MVHEIIALGENEPGRSFDRFAEGCGNSGIFICETCLLYSLYPSKDLQKELHQVSISSEWIVQEAVKRSEKRFFKSVARFNVNME